MTKRSPATDLVFFVCVMLALLVLPARSQNYNVIGVTLPAITNSAQTAKASPGTLVAYECFNPNSSMAWVQVYDSTSAVVSTTEPVARWGVQATSSSGMQPPSVAGQYANGLPLSVGLQVAATTTQTGTVAPASALNCTLVYR